MGLLFRLVYFFFSQKREDSTRFRYCTQSPFRGWLIVEKDRKVGHSLFFFLLGSFLHLEKDLLPPTADNDTLQFFVAFFRKICPKKDLVDFPTN